MRRTLVGVVAALGTVGALGSAACAPPVQPPQIAGPAGNDGPCGSAESVVDTYPLPTSVFQPTGLGFCSEPGQPVVFFAHGYFGSQPFAYQGLMRFLNSRGFVVVAPQYQTDLDIPVQVGQQLDGGIRAGVASLPPGRVDLSRIGFVGHSFGGGSLPRLIQLAADRGWGSEALWAVAMAPLWPLEVPSGPISVPAHTRYLTINYEDDVFADLGVATEMVDGLAIPDSQKLQMVIHPAGDLPANHALPVAMPFSGPIFSISGLGIDLYDRTATWRPIDIWSRCALDGVWCDADIGDLTVSRATVGLYLPDVGPPALGECSGPLSPRGCRVP